MDITYLEKKLIDDKIFFERRDFIISKAIEDAKYNKFSPLHSYKTGWDKEFITLGLLDVMDVLSDEQKQKIENGLYIETYDKAGGKR